MDSRFYERAVWAAAMFMALMLAGMLAEQWYRDVNSLERQAVNRGFATYSVDGEFMWKDKAGS